MKLLELYEKIESKILRFILKRKIHKSFEHRMGFLVSISKLILPEYKSHESKDHKFDLLVSIAKVVLPDYKFKWPYLDWWNNDDFDNYLRRFDEHKVHNADRRWMVSQLLRLIDGVEGDTAECGVYAGSTSWLICKSNLYSRNKRQHFAFDSYCGLSETGLEDGSHWTKGDLACSLDKTKENLSEFENIYYMKGWIPERFSDPEVVNREFAFVHIDVDLYEPTLKSIEFFYSRVPVGGIIVCDDYGCSTCPGATKAIDEFLTACPEKMIALSGGGGFMIKGISTN